MKKRLAMFLLVLLISIFFVSSASQKIVISSTALPISINKVTIDNNVISVLVESKNSYKEYLMFDVKSQDGTTKRYFSFPNTLNSYEATYFSIPLEVSNPTYLYVTPYHQSASTITLYDFSKIIYTFTGTEYTATSTKTSTTSSTSALTTATNSGQAYSTATTSATPSINTDDKVLYVNGIQKIQDQKIEYLHTDYLGSTRRISDATSSEQKESSDYYYFGSPLKTIGYVAETLDSGNKAFTSKEQDNSGLYYYGARYYNPAIGRFISVDPAYNPLVTPYNYAVNNPLSFIDVDGRAGLKASDIVLRKAYVSLIDQYIKREGLHVAPEIIYAVAIVESKGRHRNSFGKVIKSNGGAVGLFQLTPLSAREVGLVVKKGNDERKDIYKNILGGVKVFQKKMENFRGLRAELEFSILSYNAGQSLVKDLIEASGDDDPSWQHVSNVLNSPKGARIIMKYYSFKDPKSTQDKIEEIRGYVPKVMETAESIDDFLGEVIKNDAKKSSVKDSTLKSK